MARRDQANTFAAAQTFNLGAVIKGLNLGGRSIASNATLETTDCLIQLNGNVGNHTITLPAAAPIWQIYLGLVVNAHATNIITLDAGVGNNIGAPGSFAQTYPLNVSVSRRMFFIVKIAANQWSVSPLALA